MPKFSLRESYGKFLIHDRLLTNALSFAILILIVVFYNAVSLEHLIRPECRFEINPSTVPPTYCSFDLVKLIRNSTTFFIVLTFFLYLSFQFLGGTRDKSASPAENSENFFEKHRSMLPSTGMTASSVLLSVHSLSSLRERLLRAIDRQQRAAVFNLLIGLGFAIVGLLFLALVGSSNVVGTYTEFLKAQKSYSSEAADAAVLTTISFLARFGLAFAIEAVAFFFLVLYRANQNELRYLENEITNVEVKFSAHQSALLADDNCGLVEVLKSMADTERNFVLSKGQTTIDIAKNAATATETTGLIDRMIQMLTALGKAK
jgi:hypothetical protein